MSVSRYRLTPVGWIGAVLFILPTPVAVFYVNSAPKLSAASLAYNQALIEAGGIPDIPSVSSSALIALATATMVGLVMVAVGREIHTR